MEKRKFEFEKYADMHEEKEVTGKDGTKVTVRDHISYADKEAMANEMAEQLIMIHDDSCVYDSSEFDKIEKFMIAKYYTDIDTEGVEPKDIADFFINNEMMGDIREIMWRDYVEVEDIFWKLNESVTKTYEDDRCLTKALRTSFGFLFTGEDVTSSLIDAEDIKDKLFDAIGALRKVESEKEETIDNGKVMVGGNLINFAKKK